MTAYPGVTPVVSQDKNTNLRLCRGLLLSCQVGYPVCMKLILLVPLLVGCFAHRGLRIPGPTGNVGSDRVAYVPPEVMEPEHLEPASRGTRMGRKVARAAESFLDKKRLIVHGDKYRYDCSGMICAAHVKAGLPTSGNTRMLYEKSKELGVFHKRKRPDVGDVAFFSNTWDRNKNGRRDDKLTHIAIVEAVESDGTISLIHLGGSGVKRLVMNMRHPGRKLSAQGKRWNSVLRKGKDGGPILTGDLCVGFGSLWAEPQGWLASR